jgi:hypothetical protein
MASNRKKTEAIRDRKRKPNKGNLKKNLARIQRNTQRLKELASESETYPHPEKIHFSSCRSILSPPNPLCLMHK